MLCVQWHPERMKDRETNPASKAIREAFLKEAKGQC
jgi:putative glutamine amidotransferase